MVKARGNSNSYNAYSSEYDTYYMDPYYSDIHNSPIGAGPSRSTENDLYPSVTRKRMSDGLPSRPHPPPLLNSSNGTGRNRDASPPRKTARQDDRILESPRDTVNEKRASYNRDRDRGRDLDRPPSTPERILEVDMAIRAFVEALKAQQLARKETLDIEANNAKYLKYRDRDDISKENKAKAEKASEEIEEARNKDVLAWKVVERQTRDLLSLVRERQENGVAASSRLQVPRLITPPRQGRMPAPSAESDLEPGEIAVSRNTAQSKRPIVDDPPRPRPPPPPPGLPPALQPSPSSSSVPAPIAVVEKDVDANAADAAGKGRVNKAMTRSSILSKFEEIDLTILNVKSETEDRLDQMECNMEDLVRAEVESRVRKARLAYKSRSDQGVVIDNAKQTAEHPSASSGPVPPAPLSTSALSPHPAAPSNGNDKRTPTTASAFNGVRHDEPGMSHEEVAALVESVRQSMREEFDRKILQQSQAHSAALQDLHTQVATHFKNDRLHYLKGQQSHYEVLKHHQEMLDKHEQLWQGTLGVFSNIPKPTNNML